MSDLSNLLERLVGRCQEGDPAAFEALFEACMGRVYRLAAAILRDHKDAEDATQETLLRVFRQFNSFRRESSFETWLASITVNVCRDALRSQRLRQALSLDWLRNRADPDQPGVARLVDQRWQGQALWQAVDRLDEKRRLPLLLVYQENLSAAEAAQALNLPIRTLYARLKQAYDELSLDLGPDAGEQVFTETAEMVVNDVQS